MKRRGTGIPRERAEVGQGGLVLAEGTGQCFGEQGWRGAGGWC